MSSHWEGTGVDTRRRSLKVSYRGPSGEAYTKNLNCDGYLILPAGGCSRNSTIGSKKLNTLLYKRPAGGQDHRDSTAGSKNLHPPRRKRLAEDRITVIVQ